MPSHIPERVGASSRRLLERAWFASVGVATLAGIFVPGAAVKAGLVQDLINYILLGISFVLQWFIFFLGKLVTLLVTVIVNVAQYNNFVNAAPVVNGWPLIRDVVNMFFIVVLLVTAFSTIVQWKKFDYRKVLPKLLLMAVLVNFSKTLIGVLIDFSQILFLTFVNGFKAAATGNFVTLLKLDKIMQIKPETITSQQTTVTGGIEVDNKDSVLLKLVLAEFLGIFFLGTAVTMLLILLVYLVVRIVGLWIALIFSPAAFFVTALRETPLASKVGLAGDKYWQRLGALLSGGPTMAFFLWLTLATIQQQGGLSGFTAPAASQAEVAEVQNYFASAVGNVEDVATYFVAIIMLLMGVEAAVAISREVSETLGRATDKIQTAGMAATRFATYGGALAAGGLAARGARRAAGAGLRGVDRRLELREGLGRGLQQVGAVTGIAGIAAAGAGLRRGRAAERTAAAARIEGAAVGMAPEQRLQFLENAARIPGDRGREAGVMLARAEITPEGGRVRTGQIEAEAKSKGLAGAELAAYTQTEARRRQGDALGRLEQIATARGDQDMLKQVREQNEKRPDRLEGEAFDKARHSLMGMTPEEISTTVAAEAYKDTRVTDTVLQRMLKPDGTLDETSLDYEKLAKGRGLRAELIRQRYNELSSAAQAGGQPLSITTLNQAMAAPNMAGAYMARVEEGGRVRYVSQSADQLEAARDRVAEGAVPGAAAPARRESEIASARNRLARLRESAAPQAAIQEVQHDALLAGANLSEVYQVDQRGSFASDAERANFSQSVQTVVQEGSANPGVYQQINTSLLDQNPGGANQARTTFAASADVDAMSQAWVRADVENKPQAKTAVQNAVRIVHSEGSRVQQAIEAHNKARPGEAVAMDDVVKAAQTNDQAALNKATANMPAVISMDEAKALDKKQRIDRDELLSTFKGRGLERVQNAARRGMATAGRGARAVGRGAAVAGGAVAGAAEVATSAGRTRRRMGREFTAVAPDIEAPRAGQPGYRVGPQPPPAPRPAPPPPPAPPAGPTYTGERPEGFETGRHT